MKLLKELNEAMKKTSPYVQLAFTELNRANEERLTQLYNELKDDPKIKSSPYNDGRMVRKFNALAKRVKAFKKADIK